MTAASWRWYSDVVYGGGGAKHSKPLDRGFIRVTDEGLSVEPDDGFYSGTIAPEQALEIARAILERFGRGEAT